jgi:hypothetical protein
MQNHLQRGSRGIANPTDDPDDPYPATSPPGMRSSVRPVWRRDDALALVVLADLVPLRPSTTMPRVFPVAGCAPR